jgi:hypothetical protein
MADTATPHAKAHHALAAAGAPEEHAQKLAGFALDFATIQLIISLAQQYGPAVWEIATAIIARLRGSANQPPAGPGISPT